MAAARSAPDNRAVLAADERNERLRIQVLALPALLLVAFVILAPMVWLAWLSLLGPGGELTVENYAPFVTGLAYRQIFLTTFEISFVVVGLCVVLGYPLAYLMSQASERVAAFLLVAVVLPYMTSILVRTYAWLVLLQRNGIVNKVLMSLGITDEPLRLVHNWTGTVIGMVHIMLPFLVLPLYASMRSIDGNLLKAAASLGARPSAAFWKVYFPLSLPGLLAGIFLVFVTCLGFYVTPALLGGGRVIMIAQQIANAVRIYGHWGAASALGMVLLAIAVTILLVAQYFFRKSREGAQQ